MFLTLDSVERSELQTLLGLADTSLSQFLSPPRNINGCGQIVGEA